MTRSSSVGSSRLQFLILQFLFSSTEEKETKEKRLITAGYQVEGLIFFKFQYNLYMSDTLVSDAMTSSTGSEEHQSSMMFKPVNDIQSRLGKVLLTKTKTCTHTRNDQKKHQTEPSIAHPSTSHYLSHKIPNYLLRRGFSFFIFLVANHHLRVVFADPCPILYITFYLYFFQYVYVLNARWRSGTQNKNKKKPTGFKLNKPLLSRACIKTNPI